jgi:hypothetical protein
VQAGGLAGHVDPDCLRGVRFNVRHSGMRR